MSFDLAAAYDTVCHTPSDVVEHLPFFASTVVGRDAQKVIECGVRSGRSTVAWLWGLAQTGGRLWSVDVDDRPDMITADHWTFVQGDDLDPAVLAQLPVDVDVVFLDTLHSYGQVRAELEVYRHRVRPGGLIMVHDTALARPVEAPPTDPRRPVKAAVVDFCADEGLGWTENPRCFGLGVVAL